MRKLSILAALPLLALTGVSHAADWVLHYNATGTVWGPDGANYPLTDLTLFLHTSDTLASGRYSGSMGLGQQILGITGTRNGVAVNGLTSNASTPYNWAPDLMLYVNSPQFISFDGLSYRSSAGESFNLYGSTVNISGVPEINWFEATPYATANPYSSLMMFSGLVTIAAVPEPASWALALAGAVMLSGALRGRGRMNRVR